MYHALYAEGGDASRQPLQKAFNDYLSKDIKETRGKQYVEKQLEEIRRKE